METLRRVMGLIQLDNHSMVILVGCGLVRFGKIKYCRNNDGAKCNHIIVFNCEKLI